MKKKTGKRKRRGAAGGPPSTPAETAARHIAGIRKLANMQLVLLRDLEQVVRESACWQKTPKKKQKAQKAKPKK